MRFRGGHKGGLGGGANAPPPSLYVKKGPALAVVKLNASRKSN